MDPPLAIPKDLRPLGGKRRYLRTVQLITDPLPIAALQQATTLFDESDRVVPFEDSLRRGDRAAAGRYALQKANSQGALGVASRTPARSSPTAKCKRQLLAQQRQPSSTSSCGSSVDTRKTASIDEFDRLDEVERAITGAEEEGEEEEEEARTRPRERAKSGKLQPKPSGLLVRRTARPLTRVQFDAYRSHLLRCRTLSKLPQHSARA